MTGYLALILWRAGAEWMEIQARVVAFLTLAAQGVLLWLLWETLIFGDPLYFATSRYSAHVIDVVNNGYTENVGSLAAAARTYLGALRLSFPVWLLALGVAGLGVQGWRIRRHGHGWAATVLLCIPPFFIFSLYRGQAAIYLARDADDLHYNIRYGLVAAPLVAVLGGLGAAFLLGQARRLRLPAPSWPRVASGDLEILRDRGARPSAEREAAALWLGEHDDGGRVLLEVFKANDLVFTSRISQRRFVTEGNRGLWEPALERPESIVRWVVMSGSAGDEVRLRLSDSPGFHRHFVRVYRGEAPDAAGRVDIFRLRDAPLDCRPFVALARERRSAGLSYQMRVIVPYSPGARRAPRFATRSNRIGITAAA